MTSLKTARKISLAVAGGLYFSFFSNLNINPFLKSYMVIIPVQIAALIYGIYLLKIGNKRSFSQANIKSSDRY